MSLLAEGQRWTVLHGDCLQILPTLADKSVAHVIADPPYTQRTSDGARSKIGRDFAPGTVVVAPIDFAGIDGEESALVASFLRLAVRWVVAFCALEQISAYQAGAGDAWVRGTVWLKTNAMPQMTGDRPAQAVEGVAIAHPKGKKRWNRGGDALAFVGPTVAADASRRGARSDHPTPKPEWLMLECIEAFTDPDDLVLDPFCGSGTTGVACLRLGRRFIGIEKDEKYASIARERLEAESRGLTLRDARHGQTSIFDALAIPPAPGEGA